jgi:hypothetical protein
MTISAGALALVVSVALALTIVAPIVLVVLWIKDARKGELW